jgi:pilus assembly protein CpaB
MTQKRRTWAVLGLALLCGSAAALLALSYIQAMPPRLISAPTRQVAVAVGDLPVGTLLRPENVRLISWPADALPAGYYASTADVVGRGLTAPVRANEPLMAGKLAGKGEGGGMPPLIPDGMRAVSVSTTQVVAVAGFVVPGTRVDVLLTIERDGQPFTHVLMQNMTVLAANQTIVKDEEGKPMTVSIVTLLVTPEQAEQLTLATQEGKIQFALRNRADVEEVDTRGARLVDLGGNRRSESSGGGSGGSSAPSTPDNSRMAAALDTLLSRTARRETGTVVETYRGGVRTMTTFGNERP